MRTTGLAALGAFVAVSAAAQDAVAYESQCFASDVGLTTGACMAPAVDRVCVPGVGAARGRQLGEHTFITRTALAGAGLGFVADLPMLDPVFAPQRNALGTLQTYEPASTSTMDLRQTRRQTIAELSQLPDTSYGLPDYLLGNEHCQARQRYQTLAEVDACHTFGDHMGALNSTHFLPQAQVIYVRYHGMAMAVAARCARLATALRAHVLAQQAAQSVAACEREALALEAVGAHYLEDAWSAGHMWERWGTPVLDEGLLQRLGVDFPATQFIVGAITGVIHGWRSLAQDYLPMQQPLWHDQANLPGSGPYEPARCALRTTLMTCSQEGWPCEWRDDRCVDPDLAPVRYRDSQGHLHDAGGDLYFQRCTSSRPKRLDPPLPDVVSADENIAEHANYEDQRTHLLGCVGAGFRQVYLAGPMTLGTPGGATLPVPSSLDAACWDQRLTNHSLFLGWGISRFPVTRNPIVWGLATGAANALVSRIPGLGAAITALRIDLTTLAFQLWRRARQAPDETDLARGGLPDLLGFRKNSAYSPLIERGDVPYLERPDPAQWSSRTQGACSTDADCAVGDYCGTVREQGIAQSGRCFRGEAAILTAFRTAELAHWCGRDDKPDLTAAIYNCAANPGSLACTACGEVLLPRLRNAEKLTTSTAKDAMCDTLERAGVAQAIDPNSFIHLAYDAAGSAAEVEARARRAAECVCNAGLFPDPAVRHPSCNMKIVPNNEPATPGGPPREVPFRLGQTVTLSASSGRLPMGQLVQWSVSPATGATISPAGEFVATSGSSFEVTASNPADSKDVHRVTLTLQTFSPQRTFTIDVVASTCGSRPGFTTTGTISLDTAAGIVNTFTTPSSTWGPFTGTLGGDSGAGSFTGTAPSGGITPADALSMSWTPSSVSGTLQSSCLLTETSWAARTFTFTGR